MGTQNLCILGFEILPLPIDTTPAAICPPYAELVAGVCKCNQDLCERPPCDKVLNLVKSQFENEENCCPSYTCDNCIDKFLINGECICPEDSFLNQKGICECHNRYESIQNNTCQCDLTKCPLPNLCDDQSVGIAQSIGCCTFIECKLCPDDSYPKRYNSDLIDDKCVCNICPKTSCEDGYVPKYEKRGHNIPGDCCDVYECVLETFKKNCYINYTLYHHMESWMEDECKNCTCVNGESICTTEPSNEHCRGISINRVLEDNCIVNETLYRHLETWSEDECTNCTCINGKPKCEAYFCDSNVSIITPETQESPECPYFNCKKFCKYGFKSNKKGCQICKCRLPDKINKQMEYFMHNHNLTDDDVLIILRMHVKNKNAFEERTTTTTEMSKEIYKIAKYEHLEAFMYNHNLTEMEALKMLDEHLQNRIIDKNPAVFTPPNVISCSDHTSYWMILLYIVLIGLFGCFMVLYCKKHFRSREMSHNNNNVNETKKSSRRPKEQAIDTNEKKPLNIT
ncbi:cysteine-rich motor neuron 1 protein isoform X2 [Onthophagus taurus]|uniref:cysteine-rich motor neuron 1 protein isoform X2 n=1 Tax=Onthophagus taurus TaxID=166361 RepID=UPI0039BE7E64